MNIFKPSGTTVNATVAASSAALALGVTIDPTMTLRLVAPASNAGLVFVRFGTSTVTATTSNMPIAPGATEVFYPGSGVTHVATIGTANDKLYVSVGEGE